MKRTICIRDQKENQTNFDIKYLYKIKIFRILAKDKLYLLYLDIIPYIDF